MNKTYQSKVCRSIHETVSDMFEAGMVNKKAMRQFDKSCLMPIHHFTSSEIKELREREGVNQTVFACHLNVSKDSIHQWERGLKKPSGPSLKLLALVEEKGLDAIA